MFNMFFDRIQVFCLIMQSFFCDTGFFCLIFGKFACVYPFYFVCFREDFLRITAIKRPEHQGKT